MRWQRGSDTREMRETDKKKGYKENRHWREEGIDPGDMRGTYTREIRGAGTREVRGTDTRNMRGAGTRGVRGADTREMRETDTGRG